MSAGDGVLEPLVRNNSLVKIRSFGKFGINCIGNASAK